MTDNLIEQIKADRKAGTPGPWGYDEWGDSLYEWISDNTRGFLVAFVDDANDEDKGRIARVPDYEARILADAEVIKAAGPLVKRLKALQTYFDLSDEELASMTRDERSDTIWQHRLITKALAAFHCAMQGRKENNDDE